MVLVVSLVAGGVALRESRQAERARQVASARGIAAAATSSITVDPERGVLLGLEAVERARPLGGDVLLQAQEALHGALTASQIEWRAPETGGAVVWSPDGRHVATEGPEGSKAFDVRDAETGQIVRSFEAPEDVTDLEYSPDGTVLATTDRGGTTRLWNSTTGKRLASIEGPSSLARSPKFSPDGSMIAIVWPGQSLLRIVDVATGAIVVDSRELTGANSVDWSPDGTRVVVASDVRAARSSLRRGVGRRVTAILEGDFGVLCDDRMEPGRQCHRRGRR